MSYSRYYVNTPEFPVLVAAHLSRYLLALQNRQDAPAWFSDVRKDRLEFTKVRAFASWTYWIPLYSTQPRYYVTKRGHICNVPAYRSSDYTAKLRPLCRTEKRHKLTVELKASPK